MVWGQYVLFLVILSFGKDTLTKSDRKYFHFVTKTI